MARPFNLGIVGGGTAVGMALPALRTFESVAITYLDSPLKESLHDFHFYDNIDSLFDPQVIAALYIATPVYTHQELMLRATEAGIPTLVEKPLCLNVAECEAVANHNTEKIAVAFRKRFSPAGCKIKTIRTAEPMAVAEIDYIWLAPHPGPQHWKLNATLAGGGILMDVGSHIIDLFEYCIGRIHKITVADARFDSASNTDSLITLLFDFADGSCGRAHIGWAARESFQRLEFRMGGNYVNWIKYDGLPSSQLTVMKDQICETGPCERSDDYFAMFDSFRVFAAGGESNCPLFSDGVRNMRLLSEIYRSMAPCAQ